jgi:hypothetical protein
MSTNRDNFGYLRYLGRASESNVSGGKSRRHKELNEKQAAEFGYEGRLRKPTAAKQMQNAAQGQAGQSPRRE